jgi:glycosyltransferase involved in cell wall biosynthesis
MNILHAGNMANIGYLISKQLQLDGINAELIMEKYPIPSSDPIKLDPSLKNSYPKWIHFYDKQSSWKRKIIKKMRESNYDLIHAYVEFPIFAYLSNKPFVAHPQGSDIREMAFSNSFRGILLRRAYRKAKAVIVSSPEQIFLLKKLKLANGILIPISPEYPFFQPENISRKKFSDKFVIFHPANLDWKGKGNDILIKGFAKAIKQHPNMLLLIVDRGVDSSKTHSLVNSLNIKDKVKFINGPLNYPDLRYYYNTSDAVADQFHLGELGGIARETLCCEKPLLTSFNQEKYKEIFPDLPPISNAFTINDVVEQLISLSNSSIREKNAKLGRLWIEKNISPGVLSKKLLLLYQGILSGENAKQIRKKIGNQEILDF